MGGNHKHPRTQGRCPGSLEEEEKEDICQMAGVSAAHQPEYPPHTSRILRPTRLDLDAPACDTPRVPGSDTSRRLPESPPQPDTPVHASRTLRPKRGRHAWNGPLAHVSPI